MGNSMLITPLALTTGEGGSWLVGGSVGGCAGGPIFETSRSNRWCLASNGLVIVRLWKTEIWDDEIVEMKLCYYRSSQLIGYYYIILLGVLDGVLLIHWRLGDPVYGLHSGAQSRQGLDTVGVEKPCQQFESGLKGP